MIEVPAVDHRPRVLSVGGLDPCGGAGITADARVALACGVEAATVATCLTVQNRNGFDGLHVVEDSLLTAVLRAVRDDGPIDAIKLGLVGAPHTLDLVLEFVADAWPRQPLVVDPVLSATSGGLTTAADLDAAYRRGLPLMTLLTPNLHEAARLAVDGVAALVQGSGCAMLIKGGHGEDGEMVEDTLWTGADRSMTFRHPYLEVGPVHGTGCALATAIAAGLAVGESLEVACRHGIEFVGRCLLGTVRSSDGRPVPLVIGRQPPRA